jgi:2-polyprenyl-6-methoxyphenol hydroxylase-like FAD-dependent oxidoreductase
MVADAAALVVGAGPTGLLLASELHRRGVECRVIDAHPAPLHWDRATVVHPRSLEVFESLGLLEPLLAAGVKQRMTRLHSGGSVLGEIDLSNCGSRYGFNIGVSEEVTESILTEYLRRQGGEVIRSSSLIDLEDHGDGLLATIQRDGMAEQLTVRWVVGCDGVNSTTRKLSGIELNGHDIAEPWAVFDATLAGWSDTCEAIYAYWDEIPVILTSLPEGRWRVYLRPSSPCSDLVADAASTLRRYLPAIGFDKIASPARFHCHTKVARRFRSGRILLAGDAAHLCSPLQGHGMNSGLQDAFNLAWKLALVCRGYATTAILDSYEAERRPVAEMIAASGDAADLAQTMTKPAERRVRDETLRAVCADPASQHHEAVAAAELDIDYGGSPAVMGDENDALAPGQRLPDMIEVRLASGRTCMLHELTNHAGHTALLVGGLRMHGEGLAQLESSIRARSGAIIEETVVLTTRSGDRYPCARLAPAAADRLGLGEITLLVIRPDGHVGLRADHDHIEALAAYQTLLTSGRTDTSARLRGHAGLVGSAKE